MLRIRVLLAFLIVSAVSISTANATVVFAFKPKELVGFTEFRATLEVKEETVAGGNVSGLCDFYNLCPADLINFEIYVEDGTGWTFTFKHFAGQQLGQSDNFLFNFNFNGLGQLTSGSFHSGGSLTEQSNGFGDLLWAIGVGTDNTNSQCYGSSIPGYTNVHGSNRCAAYGKWKRVPEPSTLGLIGIGMASLIGFAGSRKKALLAEMP